MSPSYKCAVISLLIIVFSVTAPKPSAAIRSSEPEAAAGKSSHASVAPAPAPLGARHAQLQFFFGCPTFPKILHDLCHALFPPPTPSPPPPPTPSSPPPSTPSPPRRHRKPCRPSLMNRVPSCAAFLTNASVSQPDSKCCDRMRTFDDDGSMLRYCVCYVANGDADPMLPAPVVDPARRIGVVTACIGISEENVHFICDKDGNVYKGLVPPMDDPPSPPPAHEKKA